MVRDTLFSYIQSILLECRDYYRKIPGPNCDSI